MNITRHIHRLLLASLRCQPTCTRNLRNSGGRQPPTHITSSHQRSSESDLSADTRQPPTNYLARATLPSANKPLPPPPSDSLTEHDIDWTHEMQRIRAEESARSVLAPAAADFDATTAAPLTRPAHNLAAYVKRSHTLQQLLQLGVDLHRIERRNGLADFVLRLDFERDVQPRIRFLVDVGVPADALGVFLTRNPLICREDVDVLTTRVHYLQSKGFAAADIARIVEANPFWLMFSTQRIDGRLGFYQKQFELSGAEVRQLVVRQPKLITYGLDAVRKSSFVVQEELGFSAAEVKRLLLTAPKLWMMSNDDTPFICNNAHSLLLFSCCRRQCQSHRSIRVRA